MSTDIISTIRERLEALGLPYSPQEHVEVLTVAAWRPYVEAGPVPNALLTKCLFLKDKKSRNYLVFALADSECDLKHLLKEVKATFPEYGGIQTLRFGDDDVLYDALAALKGAVSPLNLIHDQGKNKVNMILDDRIAQLAKADDPSPLAVHPGSNGMTVYLKAADLLKYMESCGHTIHQIHLAPLGAAEANAQ